MDNQTVPCYRQENYTEHELIEHICRVLEDPSSFRRMLCVQDELKRRKEAMSGR